WSLLLAMGVTLGQMWVINAFCAALTVALVYRLGREVFSEDVGVIAAGLVAFSPMALLLNGSLMGHTSALLMVTLFMFAFWRVTQGKRALLWGTLAGVALGMLVMTRAITAVGISAPFIIYSGWRVIAVIYHTVSRDREGLPESQHIPAEFTPEPAYYAKSTRRLAFWSTLLPLVVLSVVTVSFSLAVPVYNNAATGDPTLNLYTLVWEYDQIGFGTCCGRSSLPDRGGEGHTLVKGIRHARFDLSLMAADLFGWARGTVDEDVQAHLQVQSDYFPLLGLSWILIPLGLILGMRYRWAQVWVVAGLLWIFVPFVADMDFLRTSNTQIRDWLIVLGVWMLLPPMVFTLTPLNDRRAVWTWLLAGVIVGLVGVHLAYWIGSQRYSTRYYFEALPAFALISALPIAWLLQHADRMRKLAIYGVFGLVLIWSLYAYSTPRIDALHDFNFISTAQIDAVEARREDDRPVLVIVSFAPELGNDTIIRWRSYGSLMGVTSPYRDSEIVAVRNSISSESVREQLIAQFPDRQVIDLYVNGNDAWFADELPVD
ncbi:MAG: glycosyltransferase family 39 protein, partial [Aggregatilineales bacterium]